MQPNISNQVPFHHVKFSNRFPQFPVMFFFPAITLWAQLFRHSYFRHNFLQYDFYDATFPDKTFTAWCFQHYISGTTSCGATFSPFFFFFPFFQFPWQRGDLRSRSPLINRSFSLSGFRVEAILLWTLKMKCTSTINMGFLTLSNEPTFTDSAILLWLIPE